MSGMRPTVYVETTIASYLTARPSRDTLIRAHQALTKQWWRDRRPEFDLFTSQFALDEAGAGDPDYATKRLSVLGALRLLEIGESVAPLAERLLKAGALPFKARLDALHLAVATANGIEYLLTWNCTHLANASLWRKIEQTCQSGGFVAPTICTPYELLGSKP